MNVSSHADVARQGSLKLGWKLPIDTFSGKDFVYRREGKGFLLYSIGGNLQDDRAKTVTFTRDPAWPPDTQGLGTEYDIPSAPEPHYVGPEQGKKSGDISWRMER